MNYHVSLEYEMKIRDAFMLPGAELKELSFAPWGDTALPRTLFQGCFVENRGFLFDLISYESDPLARFTKPGEPVYKDSCLELFCNFAPQRSADYINFEVNANGAYLIGVGSARENRRSLATKVMPEIRAARLDDLWDVMLYIPLETVWEVYGEEITFCDGYELRGNVYKCGDETETPHWLTWSPIKADKPDFHRPEQFGTFRLSK